MPTSVTVRELIRASRGQDPAATALIAPGHRPLSYDSLDEQIEYVGSMLRGAGIGRSGTVAVVLPNGPDMAVTFLGVAAYATCAPLNPLSPREELEFCLQDLSANAVVVPAGGDSPARDVAERLNLRVLELIDSTDREAGRFRFGEPSMTPALAAESGRPDDVALLLHTSGTTSRPKLVPLSHRNLCASARSIRDVLALSSGDCCLNMMPLFHIHGLVGALLSSVAASATVACSPGYQPGGFMPWMREFEPSWYSAVPTIHQSVLAEARLDGQLTPSHLRFIRSSSAPLSPNLLEELESTFGVPVIESYGMTETAHQVASNPLPPATRKPGSVGPPAGPRMAIMSDAGELLPVGEVGEIVVRGPSVMAGYANSPEATEAAFSDGWLRTGDRGRTDDDGYFYVTGRVKEMINRGGESVSPREIDEVLAAHPAVAQAVTFAVPHPTLGEDLAVAVELLGEGTASEDELRRFAFERLAPSKVPSRIVTVTSIPKGPTGKLQRIGLRDALKAQLRVEYVAPRTDLEERVIATIEDVLGTASVGATDNFFGLGGDSLKAVRVLALLSSEFQIELPAVALFLNPTAESLGLEIIRLLGEDTGALEDLLSEIEGMTDEEVHRLNSRALKGSAG